MDAQELLGKVRKIEIRARGLSRNVFAGEYHSAFRGRGMAFSEVREYQYGDDVRDIDWNVTARSRSPHIKVYEEERELTMMLLVDVSASRMFGSTDRLKKNIITDVSIVMATPLVICSIASMEYPSRSAIVVVSMACMVPRFCSEKYPIGACFNRSPISRR